MRWSMRTYASSPCRGDVHAHRHISSKPLYLQHSCWGRAAPEDEVAAFFGDNKSDAGMQITQMRMASGAVHGGERGDGGR